MNFTVTLILVLIAVIVTLGAVVYVLAKRIKEIKKEKADLQNRLESARVNVEQMSKYIDKVLKIKSDEKHADFSCLEERLNGWIIEQLKEKKRYD